MRPGTGAALPARAPRRCSLGVQVVDAIASIVERTVRAVGPHVQRVRRRPRAVSCRTSPPTPRRRPSEVDHRRRARRPSVMSVSHRSLSKRRAGLRREPRHRRARAPMSGAEGCSGAGHRERALPARPSSRAPRRPIRSSVRRVNDVTATRWIAGRGLHQRGSPSRLGRDAHLRELEQLAWLSATIAGRLEPGVGSVIGLSGARFVGRMDA